MKIRPEEFTDRKKNANPISMVTAYDFPTANFLSKSSVDILLVGDSLGTNALGYNSVFDVTMRDMIHHTAAVARGAKDKFIISDLPYNSYSHIKIGRAHV